MAVLIIELLLVTRCPIASTTLANWFHVLVNLADFTVTTKSVGWRWLFYRSSNCKCLLKSVTGMSSPKLCKLLHGCTSHINPTRSGLCWCIALGTDDSSGFLSKIRCGHMDHAYQSHHIQTNKLHLIITVIIGAS